MKTLSQILILALFLPPGAFAEEAKKEEKNCTIAGASCESAATSAATVVAAGGTLTTLGALGATRIANKETKAFNSELMSSLRDHPYELLNSKVGQPISDGILRDLEFNAPKGTTTSTLVEISSEEAKRIVINKLHLDAAGAEARHDLLTVKAINEEIAKIKSAPMGKTTLINFVLNENPQLLLDKSNIRNLPVDHNTIRSFTPDQINTVKAEGSTRELLSQLRSDPTLKLNPKVLNVSNYPDGKDLLNLSAKGQEKLNVVKYWDKLKNKSLYVAVVAGVATVLAVVYAYGRNSKSPAAEAAKPGELQLKQFDDSKVKVVESHDVAVKHEMTASLPEIAPQTNGIASAPEAMGAQ